MTAEFVEVRTTTEKKQDAERIAKALVEARLAACVQVIGPIESTYWWKGRIETAGEYLCLAKTRASLFAEVEKTIKSLHPYETPEIVAISIITGSLEYLAWLEDETAAAQRPLDK